MKEVHAIILDLLYPPKCVLCGRVLERERSLCPGCTGKLPVLKGEACVRRGQWFRFCVSPFSHEGAARELMLRYKFQRQACCAPVLGRWMSECVHSWLDGDFDLITWVPVHRRRRWKRGFDQCRLLAEEVARSCGMEPVNTLVKRRNTKSLTRTKGGMKARQKAVKDLYSLAADPGLIAGKRVLLVDDVLATGGTLEETSRVLRQGGAAAIYCVTVTKAPRKQKKAENGITERIKRLKKMVSLKKFVGER